MPGAQNISVLHSQVQAARVQARRAHLPASMREAILKPGLLADGRFYLPLTAKVNDTVWSNGNVADLYFDWARILAHASADAALDPGDVIGSGTCGSGCILELRLTRGREQHPWLKAGDVVQFSAPGLGTLTNIVTVPEGSGEAFP